MESRNYKLFENLHSSLSYGMVVSYPFSPPFVMLKWVLAVLVDADLDWRQRHCQSSGGDAGEGLEEK